MLPVGVEVFVATEPVDLRSWHERLGGFVRERMLREPWTRGALFVFVGKRGTTMKVLYWDGTGSVMVVKRLDRGRFELPLARTRGEASVLLSGATFEALFAGLSTRVVH